MRKVVGVMGAGAVLSAEAEEVAYSLGKRIAERGWVLLNGGRDCGVMDASARGARDAGGFVVGVLPDADAHRSSAHLDIAIRTGMGDGRNYVNALSSDVVVALPGKAGTLSEVCFALLAGRVVVALGWEPAGDAFEEYRREGRLVLADDVDEAMTVVTSALAGLEGGA